MRFFFCLAFFFFISLPAFANTSQCVIQQVLSLNSLVYKDAQSLANNKPTSGVYKIVDRLSFFGFDLPKKLFQIVAFMTLFPKKTKVSHKLKSLHYSAQLCNIQADIYYHRGRYFIMPLPKPKRIRL